MATVWAPFRAPRIGEWLEEAYETGWSHTFHFSSLPDLLASMSRATGLRTHYGRTPLESRSSRVPGVESFAGAPCQHAHSRYDVTPPPFTTRPLPEAPTELHAVSRGPGAHPQLLGYQGHVTRLGFVAHGDTDGLVQLDRPLTADTIPQFRDSLDQLRIYLTPTAQVIFFSCLAGGGEDGDRLLNGLSSIWPGRTVIGFQVWGETDASEALSAMAPQSPGRVREAPQREGSGRPGREGLLGPWNMYAKWSRDGVIIRIPINERDAQNHCANPACPGHDSPLHTCPGWP